MSRWSIRWQLTLWYSLALSCVLIAFSIANYATIRSYLLARVDAELIEESNELAEEVELANTEHQFRRRFQQRYSGDANFGFQVSELNGTILFGSPWLNEVHLPYPQSAADINFRSLENRELSRGERGRLLSRVLALPTGSVIIHVVIPLEHFERQMQALMSLLIVNGLLALLGAIVVGYVIARRVMVPILGITAAAERISFENLSERVPIANSKDELGRLAATLNQTFDRLQRSIGEMRRFTADAAHELRTPLAVIRTEAEVAIREDALRIQDNPDQFRRVTEVALAETTRLSNLVDQLLTLSRHDAGLQQPGLEEVSLRDLLLDVVETLRVVAEKKGQTIVASELCDVPVLGDDISLSQLFFNLIDNAVKYTPAGGAITVVCRHDASRVCVTIEDTGIGIERQHLDHLFERFYRVDASRSTGGTGLGLAICRSVVDMHHGNLTVESEPGRGSRFTVSLPARPASDDRNNHDSRDIRRGTCRPDEIFLRRPISNATIIF